MKVGIVCPYDWSYEGGVKSHIQGLSRALDGLGVESVVMAPASKPVDDDIFVTGRAAGFNFNGSVARIGFSRRARARIRRRLAERDIDVLHVHEPGTPSASLLALTQTTIPAVATFHASGGRSRLYRTFSPLVRRYSRRLRSRIAVSQAALDYSFAHLGGAYDVIPNGVDVERFSMAASDPALDSLKPFVLFVGRPEPRKGLQIAIDAVSIVRERMPVNLVAVGPGARDVPAWVHALGPLSQQRLPSAYRSADLFCAPSISGESFGIVLVEAMAAGTPVVCSDIPGYQEAAAGAALHAAVGDARATADAISSVITDEGVRTRLTTAGARRADELDWPKLAERILKHYERAVS